jgi:hypothetical protein
MIPLQEKVMALEMVFPLEEKGPGVGIGLRCPIEEARARLYCLLPMLLPSTTPSVGDHEDGGASALLSRYIEGLVLLIKC